MNVTSTVTRLAAAVTTAGCFILATVGLMRPDALAADYDAPRKLAELENEDIQESSGLAASRLREGLFWTHNDSGHDARLFAFDRLGRHRSDVIVAGADSIDWEDLASFQLDAKPMLLVADVGDNARRRDRCTLYLLNEPDENESTASIAMTIHFRYEDGPRDCEAIAVDPLSRTIYLAAKVPSLNCPVYAFELPSELPLGVQIARRVANLRLPLVTAMDISPDGRQAIILTYGHAYEFVRDADQSWPEAFRNKAHEVSLPARRQGEAICYGFDGQSLYLTSERRPTPFWELPASRRLESQSKGADVR